MKHGKLTKPSAPGDGQIKNWTNWEGAQERGEQRQYYPWRGGVRSCLRQTDGGHNIEDIEDFGC